MAFSWFAVDNSVVDHPKVMRLAACLNEPLALAYVIRLWAWAQKYAPMGLIDADIAPELERAIGWKGEPGALIDAAAKVGLLDRMAAGFLVHDWEEHQGALVQKSKRDAELKRKRRRSNGAKTARAGRKNGAQTAPAQDTTGQDTTGQKEQALSATADHVVERVFEKYKTAAQSPRSKLDDKRRRLIRARLKDFSEADLCRALDGYARSPHHQGQNDRNTRYVTLELWFRDTAHVEAGMAMAPTPTTVPATAENIAVPPEWQ